MPTEEALTTLYHEMAADRDDHEKRANFYEALAEARAEALKEKCPENEINLQTISDMADAMQAAIKEFGLTQRYKQPMWDVLIETLRDERTLKTALDSLPAFWGIEKTETGWTIDSGEQLQHVKTIAEIPAAIQALLSSE